MKPRRRPSRSRCASARRSSRTGASIEPSDLAGLARGPRSRRSRCPPAAGGPVASYRYLWWKSIMFVVGAGVLDRVGVEDRAHHELERPVGLAVRRDEALQEEACRRASSRTCSRACGRWRRPRRSPCSAWYWSGGTSYSGYIARKGSSSTARFGKKLLQSVVELSPSASLLPSFFAGSEPPNQLLIATRSTPGHRLDARAVGERHVEDDADRVAHHQALGARAVEQHVDLRPAPTAACRTGRCTSPSPAR